MANPEFSAPTGQLLVRAGKATQYAGAAVSLALVAGVAIWGYKLLVRDMTGIPVVRAMQGAVREAPSNPGGEVVPHLGLSVNAVAAAGEAAAPEDRLLLAPVQTELSEEDMLAMPMAEAGEPTTDMTGAEDITPVAAITASPPSDADLPALVPDATSIDLSGPVSAADAPMTAADVLALADQIASATTPLAPETETPVVAALAIIDRSVPGVVTALIPQIRPQALLTSAAPTAAAAPAPALSADIPVGTHLVQLGTYPTLDLAGQAWDALGQSFAEFMNGKARVIQQASSGGQTFYRLRAMGFASLDDARSFCAALAAENADCVPAVER